MTVRVLQTIQVRVCRLVTHHNGVREEHPFDQSTIRIGAISDNDFGLTRRDGLARAPRRIEQDELGYLIRDLGSTNGTYVNAVRIRTYLSPGCTISVGQTDMQFLHPQDRVEVVPSSKNRLGDIIGKNVKMRESCTRSSKRLHRRERRSSSRVRPGTGKEVVGRPFTSSAARLSVDDGVRLRCGAKEPD